MSGDVAPIDLRAAILLTTIKPGGAENRLREVEELAEAA
jgi:hypothetical protein